MNKTILTAIFNAYNKGDYPPEVRDAIDTTIDYFVNATGENYSLIDDKVMDSVSAVEYWAFKQGFRACLEIVNGSILKEEKDEQDKSSNSNDI